MVKSLKSVKIKSVKSKIEPVKIVAANKPVVLASKARSVEVVEAKLKPGNKKSFWQAVALGRILGALIIVIILIGSLFWLFSGGGLVVDNLKDGQLSKKQETIILEKISKHIRLPQGQYQIVVAAEPDKLKILSPFYNQVKIGDVVVVYEHFALIYDERGDVLVNATMLIQQ